MAIGSISTTRLTGLTSGMDTDTLIQNLMKTQQLKLDRELRAKTTLEWRQTALNDVAGSLKDFKQTYMSVLSPKNIYTASAYKVFDVEVTNNAKNAVSVTATASASAGRITINEVKQLAEAANASSGAGVAGSENLILNKALSESNFSTPVAFENDELSFSINGKTFSFNSSATMNDIMKKVNADADAGVTMKYSELTRKISVSSNAMGEEGKVEIVNIKGNAFGDGVTAGAFGIDAGVYQNGKDAIVIFDDGHGNDVEVKRSSNSFNIDGMAYTLNRTTAASDGPIDVTVKKNVDAAVEKIKGFIDGYNTLIKKLDDMVSERKTTKEKKYVALTDEEKASLSEKQIEDWEKIAKKGLLTSDAGIRGVVDSMRAALYETVSGAGLAPAQIGLKTANYYLGNKGQIELDEDALRAALEQDPDKVMSVFTDSSSSTNAATAYKENGLLNRLTNIFDQYTKGTQSITLDSMDRSMTALTKRISDLEDKMAAMEEKYYLKFAAMETALSNMQSQSSWITSMMGGGTSK